MHALHQSIRGLRAGLLAVVLCAAVAPLLPGRIVAAGKLLPCEFENVERIVAVGDVHGAYDRYVEILKAAGVVDDRARWAGGRTHLVQVGDVVDRGPDSRKVLDLLEALESGARRAGGRVHALLGNHEVLRLLGDVRYVTRGEYDAFVTSDSAAIRQRFLQGLTREQRALVPADLPLGYLEMRVAFGRDGDYGRWLRRRDAVIRINDILFVHGGLSAAVGRMPCDVVNDTVRRELSADIEKTRVAPAESLAASEDGPLWYRGLSEESAAATATLDEVLGIQKASTIVVGHTVQRTGRIQVRFDGKVFAVDTGMQQAYVPTGRASALEIKDGVFTAIYSDGREVLLDRRKLKE